MKCKNCGTDLRQNDKFCPNCGSNLADSEPHYQYATQSTNGYNETNGVATALNNAFSSAQFLIACICLSVAVFSQLFLMEGSLSPIDENFAVLLLHLMPVLGLIFLWLMYVTAKQSNIGYNSSPMKVLQKLAQSQVIITWVTIVAYMVFLLFTISDEVSLDNLDFMETVLMIFMYSLLLGSMFNASMFLAGFYLGAKIFLETDDPFNFLYGFSLDDALLVGIFAGIFLIIGNILITKNLNKCANSLIESLATGRPTFEKTGFAKIALFIMGAIFLLFVFLTGGDADSASIIVFLAYSGFFISMGLAMDKTDAELSMVQV